MNMLALPDCNSVRHFSDTTLPSTRVLHSTLYTVPYLYRVLVAYCTTLFKIDGDPVRVASKDVYFTELH